MRGTRLSDVCVEWPLRRGSGRRQSGRSDDVSGHLRGHDRVGRATPARAPRRLGPPRARRGRARCRRLRGRLRGRRRHQPAGHVAVPHPARVVGGDGPDRRRRAHGTPRRGPGPRRGDATGRPRPPVAAVRARHRSRRGDGRLRRRRTGSVRDARRPGIEGWPFDLARVRLAYGERLRRVRRTRDARSQLAAARDGFEWLGASPWSRRAESELAATGATRHLVVGRWRRVTHATRARDRPRSRPPASPTGRSPPACMCRRAPSRPTCTASSPSSGSRPGRRCETL